MQALYNRLPEKNRRLYAGVEASLDAEVSVILRVFLAVRVIPFCAELKSLVKRKYWIRTVIER